MTGNRESQAADAEHTYRDRRRRRRRIWLVLAAVAAVLVVLTARRPDLDDPCDAPSAAPRAETALMPDGLTLAGIGTVTDVRKDDRYFMVQAVTTKPVEEVAVLLQDAVVAAGYRPAGMDSEGSEAEVFFTTGPYAAGQARVQQSPCGDRWDIELVLLDRAATPDSNE
jgi:hypothetical protein